MSRDAAPPSKCDIAIIGGGAAGLAAAIFAGEAGRATIAVLDGAARIGAKILISGGGRCNVTHVRVRPDDFNGARPVVRNVLAAFDERATRRWFDSLGVALKVEDTGKLFPVSDRAATVLDALLARCHALRARVYPACRVGRVSRGSELFEIEHQHGTTSAARVILATGGRSLPRTGSDGQGWQLARALGHSVTEAHQALVPLVLAPDFFHARLSGLSLDVELSTLVAGKRIDCRAGSLLFTHFGISGPVVLDASRHWEIARHHAADVELRCNLLPGRSFEDAQREFLRAAEARPRQLVHNYLAQALPERLAHEVAALVGIRETSLAQLPREQRRALLHALTNLRLPATRPRGWDFAEVTAGGVPLAELDYRTMESRHVRGLYLIGEILDCDGRIGGFNFQWAWSTGHIAGRAAAL